MGKITLQTRLDPMFLRNQFPGDGRFNIPIIKKENPRIQNLEIIGVQNAKANDTHAQQRLVHCFKDDRQIERLYNRPEESFARLEEYACLCMPNYSFFSNMNPTLQLGAVFRAHWVGAYWQSRGSSVLANPCWGYPDSYDFCFDGYEKGLSVIISTMGTRRTKYGFLKGYEEMLKRLDPFEVWCYCAPHLEMTRITGKFEYEAKAKSNSYPIIAGQMTIDEILKGGEEDVSTWGTIRRVA